MGANKITLNTPDGEEVLIDLTGDTVAPGTLGEGVTAHDASGEPIVGTMPMPKYETWEFELDDGTIITKKVGAFNLNT